MWNQQQGAPAAPPQRAKSSTAKVGKVANKSGAKGRGDKKPTKRWVKIVKWASIALFGGILLMIATVAFVFWMYGRDPNLPDIHKLSDYQPKQVTWVLDGNGERIGEIFGNTKQVQRRTVVPFEQIPGFVIDAFVAAEDTRFWDHGGIDYWGMFRAFVKNLRSRSRSEGASTITQQVVKNLLLTPEKTFKRKIQEIILARRLEKALTKQEIVTLYLNEIYFGNGRYGIQEATRFYFGRDVSKIDLGQATLLASMPKEPENIAPNKKENWARAKERQQYVLKRLFENGIIKAEEKDKWWKKPVEEQIAKNPFPKLNSAPEWVDLARRELVAEKGEAALDKLGGIVKTTLDPGFQANAQLALQKGLCNVDRRRHAGGAVRHVDDVDAAIAKIVKARKDHDPEIKVDDRHVLEAVVTEVNEGDKEVIVQLDGSTKAAITLGTEDDERFLMPEPLDAPKPDKKGKTPSIDRCKLLFEERQRQADAARDGKKYEPAVRWPTPSERFKKGDVVEVTLLVGKGKHADKRAAFARPEGAVVILDVKTRKVKALVGGYDLKLGDFNRATRAMRQPGSSFKPFVYGTGIDSGKFTAGSRVNDAPEVFDLWRPKNYDAKFRGPMLLRTALAKSINTVAIKVTAEVTPAAVVAMAKRAGIESPLGEHMSISLGSVEVTPLEMTNALATFAAGGIAAKPRFIDSIDGKVTEAAKGEQVIRPEVAYVVTNMMQSVVTSGTATAAHEALQIPIAGKTGTSNDASDTWFVGMTPDYAVGVWVGYDKRHPMGGETGGSTAVPIFINVMKPMKQTGKAFPRPANVVDAKIDRESGLLAPDGAPASSMMTEVYVQGTAPTEYAAKPGEVTDQNQVTGEYENGTGD